MRISRTLAFALLLAVFGAVEASVGLLSQYMSKEIFGGFSVAISVIVAILRVLTTQPVGGETTEKRNDPA